MNKAAVLALAIFLSACADDVKVVTKIERVYPAPPPAGACELQETPRVAGVLDWRARAIIYADAVLRRDNALQRCQEWLRGWMADQAAPAS